MEEHNDYASKGVAGAGLGLGIAGTALGLIAPHVGLFGNNSAASGSNEKLCELRQQVAILTSEKDTDQKLVEVYKTLATYDKAQDAKVADLNGRVLALETAAPLKEQIFDQKIARVTDTMTCCCNATNQAIANLKATVDGITAVYVPAAQVTPLPMPRFNSFDATKLTATKAGS